MVSGKFTSFRTEQGGFGRCKPAGQLRCSFEGFDTFLVILGLVLRCRQNREPSNFHQTEASCLVAQPRRLLYCLLCSASIYVRSGLKQLSVWQVRIRTL